MTLRIDTVNKTLKGFGFEEQLKKGVGYFYFIGGTSHLWPDSSVYVFSLNELSVSEWVDKCDELKCAYVESISPETKSLKISLLQFLETVIFNSMDSREIVVPTPNGDTTCETITYIDGHLLQRLISEEIINLS